MTIGYLAAEFPGQTHAFLWRELSWLRRWGSEVRLISTRRPSDRDRARHAFAEDAIGETFYLWPQSAGRALTAMVWCMTRHPIGFARAVMLAFTLPIDRRPRFASLLPLLLPACVLAQQAARERMRHLHVHSAANAAVLAMMVQRIIGLPYSITLHSDLTWWGGAMREKLGGATFVAAVSRFLIDQIHRELPDVPAEKFVCCPMGVDTDSWRPAATSERADETFRIVTVARLHAGKGLDVLIRAVAKLHEERSDIALELIGDGPQRDDLQRLIHELSIDDVVTFRGSLGEDDVRHSLQQSNVFALPSRAEALGVVFMEAMSCGVPVIGADVGGVPELIIHEQTGLLVPANDVDALTAALSRLRSDAELRERLRETGRAHIAAHFDSRLGAARLYERLFGKTPGEADVASRTEACPSGSPREVVA